MLLDVAVGTVGVGVGAFGISPLIVDGGDGVCVRGVCTEPSGTSARARAEAGMMVLVLPP